MALQRMAALHTDVSEVGSVAERARVRELTWLITLILPKYLITPLTADSRIAAEFQPHHAARPITPPQPVPDHRNHRL